MMDDPLTALLALLPWLGSAVLARRIWRSRPQRTHIAIRWIEPGGRARRGTAELLPNLYKYGIIEPCSTIPYRPHPRRSAP
jgi:hypothetical protein